MGVERVDYYSDDEYYQALEEERMYYYYMPEQDPDIVPCFKCGRQMYWESSVLEENICSKCDIIDNRFEIIDL